MVLLLESVHCAFGCRSRQTAHPLSNSVAILIIMSPPPPPKWERHIVGSVTCVVFVIPCECDNFWIIWNFTFKLDPGIDYIKVTLTLNFKLALKLKKKCLLKILKLTSLEFFFTLGSVFDHLKVLFWNWDPWPWPSGSNWSWNFNSCVSFLVNVITFKLFWILLSKLNCVLIN